MKNIFTIILLSAIVLTFGGCKEAPTVPAGFQSNTVVPSDVGYSYIEVFDIFPANGATGVYNNTTCSVVFTGAFDPATISAGISISSALSGAMTEGAGNDYTLATAPGNTIVTITFVNGYSPIPAGDTITVSVNASLQDMNGTAVNNPGSWSFTVAAASDTTNPLDTGVLPTNGSTGISRTAPGISITFDEDIDPSTINSTTFTLEAGGNPVSANLSYNGGTDTATLTPLVVLDQNTLYTVTVTNGVKDLAGNQYAGTSWTFTSENIFIDPEAGAPTVSDGPTVHSVGTTSVDISWTVDEAADYILHYGEGDDTVNNVSDAAFIASRNITLNPPLTAATRYWYYIDYNDEAGNAGAPTAVTQFNTLSNEALAAQYFELHTGVSNEHTVTAATATPLVGNTGVFLAWKSNGGNDHIYGQLIDSTAAKQWNGGNPEPIFTEGGQDYTVRGISNDGIDGAIVLATRGGGNVYAKRLDSAGNLDWGYTELDTGLLITASAGTRASAVPVYAGIVTVLASGTTEHESASTMANPWFDQDLDLTALVDSDIIMDETNHDGTTLDMATGTQDFRHIAGQTANVIGAGDTWFIGDATQTTSFLATDHTLRSTATHNNGAAIIVSPNGWTPPGWLGVGDIVESSGNYARITAGPAAVNFTADRIDFGTMTADVVNHLADASADFTAPAVVIGDLVEETVSSSYAFVTAVSATDLTLDADIFPNGNEAYEVSSTVSSGTADAIPTVNHLTDAGADFLTDGVAINDIAVNLSTGATATITGVLPTDLTLSANIFSVGSETYAVVTAASPIHSGNAGSPALNTLFDYTATWTGIPVAINDLAVEPVGPSYAKVTAVTDTVLTLNGNIFPLGTENFEIYDEYDNTIPASPTIEPFYEITVNWNISVADSDTVNFYDYTGTTGTAEAPPLNPLYDNDVDFTVAGVLATYIALNYTDMAIDPNAATITGTFGDRALGLDANIFADNENFTIISFALNNIDASHIVDNGLADAGVGVLNDAAETFTGIPVQAGDVVYNLTAGTSSMVTVVAANTLTLEDSTINFANNDRYIIVRRRGVLYVWEEGGNVRGRIMTLDDAPPVEMRAAWNIAGGSNPIAISDSLGNALIAYVDGGGEVRVRKLDGAGGLVWNTEVDTQTASNETLIDIQSDNNGGIVLLYQLATNSLRVQRINSAGARQWGANGTTATAAANTEQSFRYDSGNDYALVGYTTAPNVRVCRVDAANSDEIQLTNLLSTQQGATIYLDTSNDEALVFWEDARFNTTVGVGVFGMKLINTDLTTYSRDATWNANSSGTNDTDGVSIIFNNYNEYGGQPLLIPYNNGDAAMLIWEDYRVNTEQANLYFYPAIEGYTP